MDAAAVLALTTKIGRVFQWEDSSLSYPIGFRAYDAEDFAGISEPPGGFTSLQNLSEFSRLVNLRPDGSVWSPSDSTPLWAIVSDIYSSAIIAKSSESQHMDDRVAFAAAAAPGAAPPDNDAQLKYKQFEDRSNLLIQRFRAAESSASSGPDDTGLLQKLRVDISALDDEWREHGYKQQVESLPTSFAATAQTNFDETWSKWTLSLIEDVDYQTDGHGNRFVPTVYAPGNIVESPSWVSIELEQPEIQQLLDQSDPELARRFGHASGAETSIRRIRFQATSVDVIRSWLPEGLLSSRFWRFPDSEKTLDWPGFVTGLVLLRDIEIFAETHVELESRDSEAMIKGDHPSTAMSRDQVVKNQKRERLISRFMLLFGFVFSLLVALYLGGNPYVPTVLAVPATTALFFGLYRVFTFAMRRRLFRTSKTVTVLGWVIFTAFSVTLVFGLLSFNVLYGGLESGVMPGGECTGPGTSPNASVKEKMGAAIGCAFLNVIVLALILGGVLLLVAVSSIVLLVVWLFTRYQPIRRTSRYFRQRVQPAVFDRITEETDTEIRLNADRYPTSIFVAGFRTRPLGRVPDPDAALPW